MFWSGEAFYCSHDLCIQSGGSRATFTSRSLLYQKYGVCQYCNICHLIPVALCILSVYSELFAQIGLPVLVMVQSVPTCIISIFEACVSLEPTGRYVCCVDYKAYFACW